MIVPETLNLVHKISQQYDELKIMGTGFPCFYIGSEPDLTEFQKVIFFGNIQNNQQ